MNHVCGNALVKRNRKSAVQGFCNKNTRTKQSGGVVGAEWLMEGDVIDCQASLTLSLL